LVDQADLEMTGENGSDIGSHLIQKSGESQEKPSFNSGNNVGDSTQIGSSLI
jgi:hypothetical protein